jgi:hypothetical protein
MYQDATPKCILSDDLVLFSRSTREVLDDHLRLLVAGRVQEDLARNYASNVAVLGETGVLYGHLGVCHWHERLDRHLPDTAMTFITRQVVGDHALVAWKARAVRSFIQGGVESFVISAGKIRFQTIHYYVRQHSYVAPNFK